MSASFHGVTAVLFSSLLILRAPIDRGPAEPTVPGPVPPTQVGSAPEVGDTEPRWSQPVDAEVVDPFRPPSGPYGAGNRGIEYGTRSGDVVRAVADGVVTFAGPVGSSRYIVVTHPGYSPGQLRSTYAFVVTIEVTVGERVSAGQRLATTGPGFHLTARVGTTYVDPARFLASVELSVRLVAGPS